MEKTTRRIYDIHQGNMFCTMCLLNVTNALSSLKGYVVAFGIDINTKMIHIEVINGGLSLKTIRNIINQALTTGSIPALAGG